MLPSLSILSSALPEPRTTQVSGSSATITGSPVSSMSRRSRSRKSAPPPVSTMPFSAMSAPSSGGVCPGAHVDHHRARGFGHRQVRADRSGHRFLDQEHLARARLDGGLADRAPLDLRRAAGHADYDAR